MRFLIALTLVTLLFVVADATSTATITPAATPSATDPSATATTTVTPADTHTGTDTATITSADTATATDTATITPADTHSGTATATVTVTPADTHTGTDTATITPAATPSATATDTATDTATITPADTHTGTDTATITPADTHTGTDTATVTPADTHSGTDTISISKSKTVSGKIAYPDTINAVSPQALSKNLEATTIALSASAGGDIIFFVRATSHVDDTPLTCDNSAGVNGYQNYPGDYSTEITLATDGTLVLDPKAEGLHDGDYHICIKRLPHNFINTLKNTGYLTLVGDIDSQKSYVCCDGPFGVGNVTVCSVTAVDSKGRNAGAPQDSCDMRINTLTDGQGGTIAHPHLIQEPTFVSLGNFEFSFTAYKSGCKGSAGVSYKGHPLMNEVALFSVLPDQIQLDRATSECTPNGGLHPDCIVIQRDQYDNPVRRCEWDTNGHPHCTHLDYAG